MKTSSTALHLNLTPALRAHEDHALTRSRQRLGLRQRSAALARTRSLEKAAKGCRSPKPGGGSPILAASLLVLCLAAASPAFAQTLINVDFGVGLASGKTGFAGTGLSTNDFWNIYSHYAPRFVPGTELRPNGRLDNLKLSDGSESPVSIAVTNAPGVWGNASGDKMFDAYLFAMNGSNITLAVTGLTPGRYHFHLYGHADPDTTGEQNSHFTIRSGTNTFGPLTSSGATGWKATLPWQENRQFVVFRDVPVLADKPVVIDVAPGPNGVAVINGLQILSRGTAPPRLIAPVVETGAPPFTNLVFREVRYTGQLKDNEARFSAVINVDSLHTNEISGALFAGDVAVLAPKLPDGVRLVGSGQQVRLFVSKAGSYTLNLELVAQITREEPWNCVSFTGPPAAIATVNAQAAGKDVEVQLLSGVHDFGAAGRAPAPGAVQGFLGADRLLALRWQSKAAEVARKSLVTVDTAIAAKITPTVAYYGTQFRYEILQAPAARLHIALPPGHNLTKIEGPQIRDWRVGQASGLVPNAGLPADHPVLEIEFIKPIEKSCQVTLHTEQPIESTPATLPIAPPQPLAVTRESGALNISAEEVTAEFGSLAGLRQVNAPDGSLAAYRFYGRPASLTASVQRIEPVITVADRVTARLEESRLLVTHTLNLTVEKAGIYALELTPQSGFAVSDVRGEGVDDWKLAGGELRVSFNSRVLGARALTVQLEQPHRDAPPQFSVAPLRVAGAARETAQVGAAAVQGIRLKTFDLDGLREIPITSLASRTDEILAYTDLRADWNLTLAAERLEPRIVAEVFNLVTIGDGLVGGSAVVRYGIINQGVQEFRVSLPAHWKNVEFTGANIRRKEQAPAANQTGTNSATWTISLQDKAWGGYTLVITYDHQFDPKGASLDLRGAHPLGVERETGSLAVTTAAGLKLEPRPAESPLRVIDPTELSDTDRSLVTRPILLAYRYTGAHYAHSVSVTRHAQVSMLDAVADRTQITTVLTEDGQMLTQAGFMVKNNDRQCQRFELPSGASLWACYVNGEPVKAEKDGVWTLVALPRTADRDQAFAVDLIYQHHIGALDSLWPRRVALTAPKTDVPNTYAEWQVFVPENRRLMNFGGTMTVARGTEYGLKEAWEEFFLFYASFLERNGTALATVIVGFLLVVALASRTRKSGFRGVIQVAVVFAILAILAGMLLPGLAKAKARTQRIKSVSNLKQIGLAARIYANEHNGRFPNSVEEMMEQIQSEVVLVHPETQSRYVWVGAGKTGTTPNAIIAFSPPTAVGREVLLADGSVQQVTEQRFAEMLAADSTIQAGDGVRTLLSQAATPPPATAAPAQPGEEQRARQMAEREAAAAGAGAVQPAAAHPPVNGLLGAMSVGGGAGPAGFAAPTVTGLRSIKIDLPKSGVQFHFTKVLSTGAEPLRLEVSMMKRKVFQIVRMVLQLAAFLSGLFLMWREWHRPRASALLFALGIALAAGAVGSLFIAGRVLHWLFIAAAPALALLLLIWIARKLWQNGAAEAAPVAVPSGGGIPPAAAAVAGLLFLQLSAGPSQAAAPARGGGMSNVQGPVTNLVSVLSASYTGAVTGRVAQFDVTLELSNVGTNVTVPLFGEDVALTHFSAQGGEVRLMREGRSVALLIAKPADLTLQLRLAAKLGGDVTKRQLAFAIPPALASRLTVVIDEEEADVEFPSAVSLQRTASGPQTRVEALIGSAGRVDLQWTPRTKRAADVAAAVFAQNHSLVTVGGGVINTRATLDHQITQGELRQARVRLPAGHRLLRVEGESIRTWELGAPASGAAQGGETLIVDLLKPVTRNHRLTIELERTLDALPATPRIELPHALDVQRETGLVALRGGEELVLAIDSTAGLQRVDAAEFARATSTKPDGLHSAWRFLRAGFQLVARAEAVQPQVEAVVHNHLRIGYEQLNLSATVEYTVTQAGIFGARLVLPPNFRVESVTATGGVAQTRGGQQAAGGAAIQMWVEKQEDNRRVLDVTFKERTMGRFQVSVALEQITMQLPATVNVIGVHPLDTRKLGGFVAVTSETGVGVKSGAFSGLIEIPASSLPHRVSAAGGSVLAFKFVSADGADAQPWTLALNNEGMESWIRAEIVSLVTVSETLVSGRALVRYDIQNAPVKEFRLRVPAAFKNVEIFGANIRRRDQDGEEWKVELQNKVRGAMQFTVTWEQPKDAKTNSVDVAGIEALGAERETGAVVIFAKSPLQVTEKSASGELSRIDAREAPAWAGANLTAERGAEAAALSYRYLRPAWRLALEAKRFDDATLLQALVESANLTTVVADDGQVMSEMTLRIRNNGRQFLEVTLPAKAELWSAFVAGQPVRPTKQGDVLLLPLEQAVATDAAIAVDLTFVHQEKFPRRKGGVSLASPKLGVPLKNARWEVWLPPDYEYEDFKGSMTHEASAAPVSQTYSALEYSLKETARATVRKSEAAAAVSNLKSQLEAGRNYEANEFLRQARMNTAVADEQVNRELAKLEMDFKRAQGGKLIEAQQLYSLENNARFGAQMPAQTAGQAAQAVDYEEGVAARQWDALCKAQELTTTRIQALRANLPTRGLRHSFTQVLQTEINRPMTVSFLARSARTIGWPRTLALSASGFAVVWLLAGAALARRREEAR